MASAEERLLEWLRDAHAMEEQAEQMLSGLAGRIENYPDVKAKIEEHLAETRVQAKTLRACIERRGGSTSTLKDMTGKAMALAQSISGVFVGDEIVKGALASYTFEHMEIASYKILIAAAEAVGDEETRRACEGILAEEEAMARWIEQNLHRLTYRYLGREEIPELEAKR